MLDGLVTVDQGEYFSDESANQVEEANNQNHLKSMTNVIELTLHAGEHWCFSREKLKS